MGAHKNQHVKQAFDETVEKVKRWSWN